VAALLQTEIAVVKKIFLFVFLLSLFLFPVRTAECDTIIERRLPLSASPHAMEAVSPSFLLTSTLTPLKVLSWNVQFGEGTDGVTNYDRLATWIAALGPDLVGLCEMPPGSIGTLVGLLNSKTGTNWFYHFVPKYPGCEEGNLILSRFAFVSTNGIFLTAQRSVAQATVSVGGTNVNFFATHLDDQSSTNRVTEVGQLKQWASGFAEPRIVTGDFNGGPDTSESILMADSYRDSWREMMDLGSAIAYADNPVGMHTRTRRGRIDYVFYSASNGSLIARGSRVPDTRDLNNPNVVVTLGTLDDRGVRPSDHNPVLTDFSVGTGTVIPAPTLFAEENTSRASALDSQLLTRGPFARTTELNFGADKRTRVMLFGLNLELLPGETISALSVRAIDSASATYLLPVEYVGGLSNFQGMAVIVRLPEGLHSGVYGVEVTLRGNTSSRLLLEVK
jgi:endonuclease/exonuclease/phosphatase family metal-dependent hydrolase